MVDTPMHWLLQMIAMMTRRRQRALGGRVKVTEDGVNALNLGT